MIQSNIYLTNVSKEEHVQNIEGKNILKEMAGNILKIVKDSNNTTKLKQDS